MILLVNYRERNPTTNGLFEKKSVEWEIVKNLKADDDRVDYEVEGINFYSFMVGAIPTDPDAERRFDDITVKIISGGQEIEDFVTVGSANLGITSTQDVPVFSNIPGGRGIFSSTNTEILENVDLSGPSIDSLRNGVLTAPLNFTN